MTFVWKKATISGVVPPPPVVAQEGEELTMGDLEYMAIKGFENKAVGPFLGNSAVVGTLVSHIVPSGKTFYLGGASVTTPNNSSGSSFDSHLVEVRINGVAVDYLAGNTAMLFSGGGNSSTRGGSGGHAPKTETSVKGIKLVGDGIKTVSLEITAISGTEVWGTIWGFEEDTGDSPQISGSVGSDIQFLSRKQFTGDLVSIISPEFNTDAVQITHPVPASTTFYLVGAKLYPVVDSVRQSNATGNGIENRRADVEVKLGGSIVDVLTHDFESARSGSLAENRVMSATGVAAQYDNLAVGLSLDGAANVELESTNTSGTYRCALLGFQVPTGTTP